MPEFYIVVIYSGFMYSILGALKGFKLDYCNKKTTMLYIYRTSNVTTLCLNFKR